MSELQRVRIAGSGSAVPDRVVTNDDLTATLDTTDEWILSRTGIRERRWTEPGASTATLAVGAAERALAAAGLAPADVEFIILATVSPDYRLPFTAALVQRDLGLTKAQGFDLSSGCAGFVQAFQVASQFIKTGVYGNALVIGAERMTSLIDPKDRNTAVLFGDGAGAMVLKRAAADESSDFLAMSGGLRGNDEILVIKAGGSRNPITAENMLTGDPFVHMKGREVFRFAVDCFTEQIQESCRRGGVDPTEVKLVVPHQVNQRILENAVRRCSIPMDRVVINLDRYGNTAGASIPIAFDEALRAGRLNRGDLAVFVSFGSGLAWASALFRY